jgi:hypothetical protein
MTGFSLNELSLHCKYNTDFSLLATIDRGFTTVIATDV